MGRRDVSRRARAAAKPCQPDRCTCPHAAPRGVGWRNRLREGGPARSPPSVWLPPLSVLHLRAGADDGRGGEGVGRTRGARRAYPHRAFRHGLREAVGVRHVQMTRLVWLVATILVVACLLFAIVQTSA